MLRDRVLTALAPRRTVHAHCDVPCGIYDPHGAQLAAKTVSRMVVLINENLGTDVEQRNKLIRSVKVKEDHAELCKRELQILWSDYFKPEHLEAHPDLHDLFWKALKQAGKCKQSVDAKACADLEAQVDAIAAIFWETKGGKPS
ncbi:MAG TPA: superoxide dismutase, Ni [Candidatus Limnocylindrales bacterium]|jgi:nickel superoxide dismutase